MSIETFNVTKFMLAMGFDMPTYRDFEITNRHEWSLALLLHERAKPFFCKVINRRVRPVYLGPRRMTVEIMADRQAISSPENPS